MISTLNVGARYLSLVLLCTGPFVGLNVSMPIFFISKPEGSHRRSHSHYSDSDIMGDNCGPTTKDKAGGPDSHRKLCLFSVTLVYTVLLPSLTRASIPNGWGNNHCWVWIEHHLLYGHPVLVY